MIIFIIANLTVTLIYGYLTLQLVNYNQRKYQEKYAASSTYLSLEWLRWLVYFLIALPFQGAISNLVFKTFGIHIPGRGSVSNLTGHTYFSKLVLIWKDLTDLG